MIPNLDLINNKIYTKRLILREINEDDTEFIVKLRSNYDVYRFFVYPHKISIEEHLEWYRNSYLKNNDRIDMIAFNKQEPIGIFGINRNNNNGEFEVNYILSTSHYKRGYAREAVESIINYGKIKWNCNTVIAIIHNLNKQSINFIQKIGFSYSYKSGKFICYRRNI